MTNVTDDPYVPAPQLSHKLCNAAWELVLPAIESAAANGTTNKLDGTLVVLNSSNDSFLSMHNVIVDGNPKYLEVALEKAKVSLETGLSSSLVQQRMPYLYKVGNVKWGGSTVMPGGIVIAFSGVQAVFDEMIAEWFASALRALSCHEMTRDGGVMQSARAHIGDQFL